MSTPSQRFGSWSLQRKITAVVVFVVLAGIGAVLSIQQFVIAPSFSSMEQDEAIRIARRCVGAFNQDVQRLRLVVENWGSWDDTYQFAIDRNEAYIKNNLSLAAFRHSHLNLVCIVNTEGKRVWGGLLARDMQTLTLDSPILDTELAQSPSLTRVNQSPTHVAGLLLTSEGPMILASVPIFTNAGAGPSHGAIIMGKFIDESLLAGLGEQAGAELAIWPITGKVLPDDKAAMLSKLTADSPYVCRAVDPKTIGVFTTLPDVENRPCVLLEARISKYLIPNGALATRNALLTGLLAGAAILGVLILFLQEAVIRPLRELTRSVVGFSLNGESVAQTVGPRGDEIGVLAREFGAMKTRIITDAERCRQSEARLQAILVSAPDGIFTLDENGTIESANPAAADMFGYEISELLGQNWRHLVTEPPPARDPSVDSATNNGAVKAHHLQNESTGVRKDGTKFPLHVNASVVDLGDRSIVLGIFRDITELNRMQERVLRSEHLAAIGEMGASVAHEIRNPIAGISGAIQVLRDSLTPEDTRREIMQEIIAQISRVDLTVRDLLMLAKPWSPELQQCSVNDVVHRAIEGAKLQDTFHRVTFEYQEVDLITTNLDPYLMGQVLWNLFRNAAHAMPDGGTIRCAVATTPQSVRITVADTGAGMSSEVMDKVFRPFYTTKTRGTGLGLPVARQIIEAHGGSIIIQSAPGKGAKITIDLPKTQVAWQVTSYS